MQAQDRPRFRQDLIAELIEEQGARFVDVVAPESNNIFRFYEVEYSIACAMDGERDVAGIVKWAQEELGVTPSPKEVHAVIATLAELRFIGNDGAVAADAKVAKAAPTSPEKVPAKAPDTELAPGVVAGANVPRSPAALSADVELGASGARAPAKVADLPKAPDFALGAPGAPPVAAPPRAPVEDIALGAPGSRGEPSRPAPAKAPASEIGMDLSAHMGVGTDDVKEAVRKSKAISAVDVPKELLEAEAPKPAPEKQPVAKQAEPQAAKGSEKSGKGKSDAEKQAQSERDKKAAADKKTAAATKAEQDEKDKQAAKAAAAAAPPLEKKADKAPEKAADKKSDKAAEKSADKAKPAVELPKRPTSDKPTAPPAPASGVSPVLVVLLILAIVGAGTFFVWKFVLSEPETTSQKQPVTPPKPLPPPPPPAEVTSKLSVETQAAQIVRAPVAGTIETIEAADKEVKAGDVVATLAGGKPLTTEIANLTKQIETATPAIDAATKALEEAQQKPDNAAGVTSAQAKVDRLKKPLDEKKATLEKKKADLDKLQVKATADGKLADVAKVGQKVALDETIASVARPSLMVASFKVPPGTKMAADGNLSVVAGDKTIVCTVIDAQAETVKVSCPADGLTESADVKFTLPK